MNTTTPTPPVIAIHGGAGTLTRAALTPAHEAEITAALRAALAAGWAELARGAPALDAVEAAVCSLEDCPLFNAGRGSVFTHDGRNEMDAAVMDGATGAAGAVANVTTIKNPVRAARAVMERSRHVLLAGPGAEAFAAGAGLEIVDPAYFHTPHRWAQLEQARARDAVLLDHDGAAAVRMVEIAAAPRPAGGPPDERKYGTVGAVALDAEGRLAAATSTGGLTNKMWGRVGDTPMVGAGNFANAEVAVSGTGTGEYFMRGVVAYDIAARMAYKGLDVDAAVAETIAAQLDRRGGAGGVIALDRHGHAVLAFNTEGMYRGVMRGPADVQTAIYRDAG